MIGEVDLFGVFVSTAMMTAATALLVTIPLRRLLHLTGVMRLVWHPSLVEICLFFIIWSGLTALIRYGVGWLP